MKATRLIFTALLLVLWLVAPLSVRTARADATPRTAEDLLGEFLGVGEDADSAAWRARAQSERYRTEALIATIPEPDQGFDRTFHSLIRALEASGFSLDRRFLPWLPASEKPAERLARPAPQERDPGIVLFVKDGPDRQRRRLLVVFLVGETPTLGIHKDAFARAVEQLRRVVPDERLVRVLGPTFSGSARSLRLSLDDDRHRDLRFRLITGSATSEELPAILSDTPCHSPPCEQDRIHFSATVIPDLAMQHSFFQYLHDHQRVRVADEVAVLIESSDYGQGLVNAYDSRARKMPPDLLPRLRLRFPINIKRLHQAWDRERRAHPPDPSNRSDAPRVVLQRAAQEPGEDAPPPIDDRPLLSPRSVYNDDLALRSLLTTISEEHIRYIGVFATDTEDKRFLAEQVRRFCPDVVLFTFESDIAYTHPDDSDVFHGMRIASTYPLHSRNQLWSYSFQGRRERSQFVHSRDLGVYNAVLALLDRDDLLLEYAPPFLHDAAQLRRTGVRPPIWLSVVGNDGLYPLATISDYQDYGYLYRPLPERLPPMHSDTPAPPHSKANLFYTVFLMLAVVGLFHGLGYFAPAPKSGERGRGRALLGRLLQRFRPRPEDRWQVGYFLGCWLPQILGVLFFLTYLILMVLAERPVDPWTIGFGLLATVSLLALLASLLDFVTAHLRPAVARRPWLRLGVALAILPLLSLLLSVWQLWPLWRELRHGHYPVDDLAREGFFFFRLINPGFGLSPAAPLFLLGLIIYLWGFGNLRRIELLVRLRQRSLHPPVPADCRVHIQQMERDLQSPFPPLQRSAAPLWALALLGLLIWGGWVALNLITLEERLLDRLLRLSVTLAPLCLISGVARFVSVWGHLRRLLFDLAHHDLVDAFDRMPGKFSRTLGAQLLQAIDQHSEMEALKQHFLLLRNHFRQLEPALAERPWFQPHHAALTKVLSQTPGGSQPGVWSRFIDGHLVPVLEGLLQSYWEQRPLPGAVREQDPLSGQAAGSSAALYAHLVPDAVHLWMRLCEETLALRAVVFIDQVLSQLRNLAVFITVAMLLMVLSMTLYPFQPHRYLMLLCWVLILSVVGISVAAFIEMNRDEVLSRIAKSKPGEVTWSWSFVSHLLVYGLVPVLSLLAAQFPEVRGFLFSWVEPVIHILNK